MLKVTLILVALGLNGQPFQGAVPVASVEECIEKGRTFATLDPAEAGAQQLGFACIITDERPRA